MNIRFALIPSFLTIACIFDCCSFAGVVGTVGSVVTISPPLSVVNGQLTSNTASRFFLEQEGLVLDQDAIVDVTASGFVDSADDLTPGLIPTGTVVDSYFLAVDTETGQGIVTFLGEVTFDTPVLGVIVTTSGLDATDAALGSGVTQYAPDSIYRGFDGPTFSSSSLAVGDILELSADRRTVSFEFHAEFYNDQIRIITATVPEPSSLVAVASLCSLFLYVRRFWSPTYRSQPLRTTSG